MNEQPGREWEATNSYTSWSISAGKVMTRHGTWAEAPVPSGKPALLIGAAVATKIRSTVKAGGNPLEGIGLEETQRALAADLGYTSGGGRQHQELARQVTGFAVSTFHMAEWWPEDAEGGRRYSQQSTTLASGVQLYVPCWGDVLDGLDSFIVPSQLLVDLALDPKTPPARLDALARMSGPFPMQVAAWLEKVLYSIKDGPNRERRFEWSTLYDELTRTHVGHRDAAFAMPLDAYIDETMTILQTQPDATEVHVERVKYLRYGEARGDQAQVIATLNRLDAHAAV